ncbi:hypothetical protein ACH5RR_014108 [Cinchona calisaya]|uniref:Zinc-finger domain-containing protein n=1 Tax=Cinchona calisaya TaxID=153742 RepID=A0ABD3A1Y6_9GENT
MVTLGDDKPPIPSSSYTPANLNSQEKKEKEEDGQTKKAQLSEYEQSREERIKQNLERMQKLGILDLSLKLKSLKPTKSTTSSSIRRTLRDSSSPLPPPGPTRRSSRLQNATPVCYSETHLTKKDNPLEDEHDLLREEGSKPEFYTEDHEKLLGSTEMSWTPFVDGYGTDGKRIYDPVNGKTCHQCRQKTLGHRTHCSKCDKVQGQFCGDCLYMRYGEHVLEAKQNPNWICPVCRGICNCSLCRQAKGWPPTGSLYRKISTLGFKSVAHYLIQTRRSDSDLETDSGTKVPNSVKRSLPFSDTGEISIEKVSFEQNVKPQGLEYPQSEAKIADNCIDDGKQEHRTDFLKNKWGDSNVDNISELILQPELARNCNTENPLLLGKMGKETDFHVCINIPWENTVESSSKLVLPDTPFDAKGASETELETKAENLNDNKEGKIFSLGKTHLDCIAPESSPMSNKKHGHTAEPVTDSIAGRLRQRRKTADELKKEMSSIGPKNGTPDKKQELCNTSTPCKAKSTLNQSNSATPGVTPVAVTDTIARRLTQQRLNQGNQYGDQRSTGAKCSTTPDVAPTTRSNSRKKRACISEPSSDSIAGRLRQRRAELKVV